MMRHVGICECNSTSVQLVAGAQIHFLCPASSLKPDQTSFFIAITVYLTTHVSVGLIQDI